MIKSRIASTTAPRQKGAALASWFCAGASGLMLLSAGCGGAPVETLEGEESVGHTEQAVTGSVLDYVKTIDHRFELGLNNINGYAQPYYNIRYGILGAQQSTATNYGGRFYLDGATAGVPYTFSARACNGYGWGGGWGSSCTDWSAPYDAFVPYAGSKWGYSDTIGADGIAAAWGAGYYPDNGANVALPICSAYGDGDQYLGYWNAGGCSVGYGGDLFTYPSAQVLLEVPSSAYWSPYSYGVTPHSAMKGGYYQGRPLYSCRTLYQGAYVPGWTSGNACTIGWDGGYYMAPSSASQILCF
jgi:hypothetical protein